MRTRQPTSIRPNCCGHRVPHEALQQRRRARPPSRRARARRDAPLPSGRGRAPDRPSAASACPTAACRRSRPGPRSSRSRSAITKPSVVSRHRLQPLARVVAPRRLIQQHAATTPMRRGRRARAAGAAATGRTARRARPPSPTRWARPRPLRRPSWRPAPARARTTNACITWSLASCFMRPCSSATRCAGKHFGLQVVRHLGGRLAGRLFSDSVDERIDRRRPGGPPRSRRACSR